MRLVHAYLIVYFVLLAAAVFTLWNSGILARVSPIWTSLVVVAAVGFGALLALTTRSTTRT